MTTGMFWGVGVGPGPAGLVPVAAVEALKQADIILAPRAKSSEHSVARQCLSGLGLPEHRIQDIVYNMDPDRTETLSFYKQLAQDIAEHLKSGKNVAYLTIGDSLTYSTYSYTLEALLELVPELRHETFPGITSYAAIAAALDWPLGQGKERVLILPCPDDAQELRHDLQTHDVVVLMKIGKRLPMVISVLKELGLEKTAAFGSRIGLQNQSVSTDLEELERQSANGYLMTMLIRTNKNGVACK